MNIVGNGQEDGGESVSLQPLRRIDSPSERAWAAEWLTAILAGEGVDLDPVAKELLWAALCSLASAPPAERTLTGLVVLLQDMRLKQALAPFCLSGPWGQLLDGEEEGLSSNTCQVFETEGLVGSRSQSATGALQAAQAGNQLVALQIRQVVDMTAVMAAASRAQAIEAARGATAEAEGRARFARFVKRGPRG
ncbi:hypothetical protein [Sphingobium sp. TomTYG45]